MKVTDYRKLLDRVWAAYLRLRNARTDDHARRLCMELEAQVKELKSTPCPGATNRDMDRQDMVLRQSELLMQEWKRRFNEADGLWAKLAFAEDW